MYIPPQLDVTTGIDDHVTIFSSLQVVIKPERRPLHPPPSQVDFGSSNQTIHQGDRMH